MRYFLFPNAYQVLVCSIAVFAQADIYLFLAMGNIQIESQNATFTF